MKLSNYILFCYEYKEYGLEYALRHTKDLGFDAVEFLALSPGKSLVMSTDRRELKALLRKYSLYVSCFSVCADLSAKDWDDVKPSVLEAIDLAHYLGSKRFHHTLVPALELSESSPSYDDIFDTVVLRARELADYCNERGITCLYEPQGMYFNGVDGLGRFYNKIKSLCKDVGICGDVGNPLFADTPATDIYNAFIDDIKYVHIKDYVVSDTPFGEGEQLKSRGGKYIAECALGDGVTDFGYVFGKLLEKGYDGELSFEFAAGDAELERRLSL